MNILLFVLFLIFQPSFVVNTVERGSQPQGHFQPLGSHRPPETNLVDDLDDIPSPQEFWEKYVKPSRAVVLRGAAKHSNAFKLWTDDYLIEKFGHLEVRLERKKEKSGNIPIGEKGVGRDTIGNFIKHYHQSVSYIISELPTPMWPDISVQPCLVCGSMKNRLVEVDLWMSGGGSSSILHKDAFNAINCLYNGTKEWKMIEYKYESKIYKAWEPAVEIGGFSRINPLKVDLVKYPKVAEVPWSFVTVNAGDCLFLPKSYYHQVTSYGTMNVAVAILFSRFDNVKNIDMTDCHGNQSYTPMSELDMDWKYPGHGNLSMGNPDLEDIRTIMKGMVKPGKANNVFFKEFKQFFPEKSEEWIRLQVDQMKKAIGLENKETITSQDINNLSRNDLRAVAMAVQPTDMSNTEMHEYTYVSPIDVRKIVSQLLKRHGKLDKLAFIDLYKKAVGGTEKFGNEILSKLSSTGEGSVSKEDVAANIDRALSPFDGNQREPLIPPGQTEPEENEAYEGDIDEDENDREDEDEGVRGTENERGRDEL